MIDNYPQLDTVNSLLTKTLTIYFHDIENIEIFQFMH